MLHPSRKTSIVPSTAGVFFFFKKLCCRAGRITAGQAYHSTAGKVLLRALPAARILTLFRADVQPPVTACPHFA